MYEEANWLRLMYRSTLFVPALRAASTESLNCEKSMAQVMLMASSSMVELPSAVSFSQPARKQGLTSSNWQHRHSPVRLTVPKPRTVEPEKQLESNITHAQTRRRAPSL